MNKQKIAILIDSGTDVPTEYKERENVFVLPLHIIFSDSEYTSNIDADTLYARLKTEIPKTSLPSGQDITDTLAKIIAAGFEKVITITISSALSGTCNFIRTILEDYPQLQSYVVDTKNISVASGLVVMQTVEDIESGLTYEEIIAEINNICKNCKIFFTVNSLEYLKAGGRIGLVSATIGEMLNLKPIISCNDDGIYHSISKARGMKKTIQKMQELLANCIGSFEKYRIIFVHAHYEEEVKKFEENVKKMIPSTIQTMTTRISPALGVHTGPEAFGVAIQVFKSK